MTRERREKGRAGGGGSEGINTEIEQREVKGGRGRESSREKQNAKGEQTSYTELITKLE